MAETLQRLLPFNRFWQATEDRPLLRLLRGLATPFESAKVDGALVMLDQFAGDTRQLGSWENQFAAPAGNLTTAERRARLAALQVARGGQDPAYITGVLQAEGFPVFTHEWWELLPHGVPRARDPREYLRAEYGGNAAEGHLLTNQVYVAGKAGPFPQLDEPFMQLDEPNALLDYFSAYTLDVPAAQYVGGAELHPLYLYLGGETFPDTVDIPAARRTEFERRVISLLPAHFYKVLRVRYV